MSIAFIFPGQGSQSVGMGQSLAAAFPEAKQALDEADSALGGGLLELLSDGPEEALKQTANTQPVILAVSIAALRAFTARLGGKLGEGPAALAGHSLGEWSALVASGALSLTEAVRAVRQRGRFMQEAVPAGEGAMAAILGLTPKLIGRVCSELSRETSRTVQIANFNAPEQTVIAGHADAVEQAIGKLKEAGAKRALPLPVSAPFHCALMQPVQPRLDSVLRDLHFGAMSQPVWSNVRAQPNQDAALASRLLVEQVVLPVRWVEIVEGLKQSGVTTLVELGPGKVLAGLVRRIDKSLRCFSVEDEKSLLSCVQEL